MNENKEKLKKLACKGLFCKGKCVKLCKDEQLMKVAKKIKMELKKELKKEFKKKYKKKLERNQILLDKHNGK